MAPFPDQDIEISAAAAFGADLTAAPDTWTWTDLSARILDNPITISRGVVVGAGTTKTGSATGLTMLNDDGHLTPFLPTSPYWPYVDVGTPAKIEIRTDTTPYLVDTFTRTIASGWGTSDNGLAWSSTTNLSTAGGKGIYTFPAANTVRSNRVSVAHYDVDYTWDQSIAAVSTGAPNVVGPYIRQNTALTDFIWPAAEFSVGGGVQWTVRTYVASVPTIRISTPQPGLTYSGGTVLRCRVIVIGDRLRARAWLAAGTEPTGWAVDITLPVLTGTVRGDNLAMAAWIVPGNSNSLPNLISIDNINAKQPKYPRIEGYITDARPTFRPKGDGTFHSAVQIDIGGIGSRLERRTADELSPLRRSIQKAPTPPVAYWPLEDKAQSTSAASAFPDQPAMVVTGPVVFEFDLGDTDDNYISRYGTSSLTSVAAGVKLTAAVPVTSATAWTVSAMVSAYTAGIGGGVTEQRLFEWSTPSGTFQRWALIGTLTGHVVRAYNDTAGTSTNVVTFPNLFRALQHMSVTATQNGGNIDVTVLFNANPFASGSVAGTIGAPNRAAINPDQVNTTGSVDPYGIRFIVGHFTVHNSVVVALPYYGDGTFTIRSDHGWAYEMAHERALRLADEENVALRVIGDPEADGPTRLNTQPEGGFVDLLRSTAESESGGLLVEEEFGYTLIDRTARYNKAVDLTVDMATYARDGGTDPADVLVPKLDARGPTVWTVERRNASAATAAAVDAYRERRGTVADKAVLDVLYDSDTVQHATWRVHLSVDGQGANYPQFGVDFAANPGLIQAWLWCRIGSRVQRTNQPTIAGLGVIDQVIDGMSEVIGRRSWTASIDGSPAAVWDVGVYDTSRYDSASTTLAEDLTTSETAWDISTVNGGDVWGGAWDSTPLPYDVMVGGEQCTVTAVTAPTGSGPYLQTMTCTRSVNGVVKPQTIGTEIHVANPGFYAL